MNTKLIGLLVISCFITSIESGFFGDGPGPSMFHGDTKFVAIECIHCGHKNFIRCGINDYHVINHEYKCSRCGQLNPPATTDDTKEKEKKHKKDKK
jgi:DNA-directed RNA polymerase subunit RPC12/RpoP